MRKPPVVLLVAIAAALAGQPGGDREMAKPRGAAAPHAAGRGAAVPDRDVERAVIRVVGRQTGVDVRELSRATHLKRDLMCDDLDTVEITIELEDVFGIAIREKDTDEWQTVGKISDYVRARRKGPNPKQGRL